MPAPRPAPTRPPPLHPPIHPTSIPRPRPHLVSARARTCVMTRTHARTCLYLNPARPPFPDGRPSVLGGFPRRGRRAQGALLRGEELVELAVGDLRTYVEGKADSGKSGAERSALGPTSARRCTGWRLGAASLGQPAWQNGGEEPASPAAFRHSLRTKLAHEGLKMGASDQPLLLCDDVGEDLLPALSHLA